MLKTQTSRKSQHGVYLWLMLLSTLFFKAFWCRWVIVDANFIDKITDIECDLVVDGKGGGLPSPRLLVHADLWQILYIELYGKLTTGHLISCFNLNFEFGVTPCHCWSKVPIRRSKRPLPAMRSICGVIKNWLFIWTKQQNRFINIIFIVSVGKQGLNRIDLLCTAHWKSYRLWTCKHRPVWGHEPVTNNQFARINVNSHAW